MLVVIVASFWFATLLLTGCAIRRPKKAAETIPSIHLAPNSSGITLGCTKSHGPKNLLLAIGTAPDVPSGTWALVERIRPILAGEPHNGVLGGIEVVSIERPEDYDRGRIHFADTIREWRLLIDTESMTKGEVDKILYQDQLEEIPWQNAGRAHPVKLRRCAFPWGNAVLFLTVGYSQGHTGEVVNNERLLLVVQGITHDGRYAVHGHFVMRNPRLPSSSEDKSHRGKVIFDFDDEEEKAAKWLGAQPEDSFEPTFLQYETFLQSLQIEPPTKS